MFMNNPYQQIIDKLIYDNKDLKDLLTYNGVCYWWFLNPIIYKYLVSNKKFVSTSSLRSLLCIIARHSQPFMMVYDLCIFLIWSPIYFLFGKNKLNRTAEKTNNILFYQDVREWRTISTKSKKQLQNIYHGNIASKLSESCQIKSIYYFLVGQELAPKTIAKYIKIQRQGQHSSISSRPLVTYWSPTIWKEERQARKYFENIYNIINKNTTLFNDFSKTSNISVKEIQSEFSLYFRYALPLINKNLALYNRMLKKENPILIVMCNEQEMSGRILQYTAKKHDVLTVGIQHGLIIGNLVYLYHETDFDAQSKNISPRPDLTLVWGNSDKNFLTEEGRYAPESVFVSGNPRYDHLVSSNYTSSRNDYCTRHGINPSNLIVLWATQSQGWTVDLNNAYLREVFSTINHFNNVTLIIKQHPLESARYDQFYQDEINKSGNSKIILENKKSDVTKLVSLADAIIVTHSTVGYEAVAFHKPLIILDFNNVNKDIARYVHEGVGIPVFSEGELQNAILKCITNSNQELIKYQNRYIESHLGYVDGKNSERCVAAILSLYSSTHEI